MKKTKHRAPNVSLRKSQKVGESPVKTQDGPRIPTNPFRLRSTRRAFNQMGESRDASQETGKAPPQAPRATRTRTRTYNNSTAVSRTLEQQTVLASGRKQVATALHATSRLAPSGTLRGQNLARHETQLHTKRSFSRAPDESPTKAPRATPRRTQTGRYRPRSPASHAVDANSIHSYVTPRATNGTSTTRPPTRNLSIVNHRTEASLHKKTETNHSRPVYAQFPSSP